MAIHPGKRQLTGQARGLVIDPGVTRVDGFVQRTARWRVSTGPGAFEQQRRLVGAPRGVHKSVTRVDSEQAGRVVERGTVDEVLLAPTHPYTEGLLESTPSTGKRGQRLNVIQGTVANPFNLSPGCNFTPRCPYAFAPCPVHDPRIEEATPPDVACWLYTRARGEPPPPRQRPVLPPLEANR